MCVCVCACISIMMHIVPSTADLPLCFAHSISRLPTFLPQMPLREATQPFQIHVAHVELLQDTPAPAVPQPMQPKKGLLKRLTASVRYVFVNATCCVSVY